EACYEMNPPDQISPTPLSIGQNLKEHGGVSDQVCFEICDQIVTEPSPLLNDEEKQEMALVNLRAARKAMTRAAYEHALKYSLAARDLSEQLTKNLNEVTRLGISQVLVLAL